MSGRKVGQKTFDWIKIFSKVPKESRPKFNTLRSRYEANKTNLAAFSEKPELINWDYYKQNIPVPGLVEKFEKSFSAVSIPYPKDTGTAEIEMEKKTMEKEAVEAIQEANKKMAELEAKLSTIKAEKAYEDMTIDEYLADKPELRNKIETDTRNHVWYLGRD